MKGCGFHNANPANQFKPDKSGRKAGDKRGIGKRPQQPPCWIDLKWLPNKGDYSHPIYKSMASWGITVQADLISQVKTPSEFNSLIGSTISKKIK